MLQASLQITLPEWFPLQPVRQLVDLLQGDEDHLMALLVGGCVRNALLHETETDIDIATKHTPSNVMDILQSHDIKVIPTGIDHGTVTAVIDGKGFEITTLRRDNETDGRHATVSYTHDWIEDAKRRDFTMNTLLMDADGNVFDPLGCGIEDAQNRSIRFVGDPVKRIQEDYLRILRFFRFGAQYGQGDFNDSALNACRAEAQNIYQLSAERITQEFLKILSVPHPIEVLKVMVDYDALKELQNVDLQALERLCALQNEYDACDVLTRLHLCGEKMQSILSLSNAQKKTLSLYRASEVKFESVKDIKKHVYYQGNETAMQLYFLWLSLGDKKPHEEYIRTVQNFKAPVFPVTGDDLIAQGFKPGPQLGEELKRREEEWLQSVLHVVS